MIQEQNRINISIKDNDLKKVLTILEDNNLSYDLIENLILEPVYEGDPDYKLAQEILEDIKQGKEKLIPWELN